MSRIGSDSSPSQWQAFISLVTSDDHDTIIAILGTVNCREYEGREVSVVGVVARIRAGDRYQ